MPIMLIIALYLQCNTKQKGTKMAVKNLSTNSYTFKGKSSDIHFNTQQNADIFWRKTVSWMLPAQRHFKEISKLFRSNCLTSTLRQ